MTVWPMETVSAVGRLRVMGYESREVYARFIDDARRLLRERLARSLVDAARTHGVEIDPRDTVMVEVAIPEENAWTRKFETSWQPQTTIVKLVGGPKDGSVMDVKDAPTNVILVPAITVDPFSGDLHLSLPRAVTYECIGWSETHRCWIYSPTR